MQTNFVCIGLDFHKIAPCLFYFELNRSNEQFILLIHCKTTNELDLFSCPPLTFEAPDLESFPCLALALDAAARPGSRCAVLNGANEAAVRLFLDDQIGFMDIAELVQQALETVPEGSAETLNEILEADSAARDAVLSAWKK
jgi:1-deoxy-D-xylulose 5-phosphate reductoisomerase